MGWHSLFHVFVESGMSLSFTNIFLLLRRLWCRQLSTSLKLLCGYMKYVLSMSVKWKSELSLFQFFHFRNSLRYLCAFWNWQGWRWFVFIWFVIYCLGCVDQKASFFFLYKKFVGQIYRVYIIYLQVFVYSDRHL